jgi:hypothetical protein
MSVTTSVGLDFMVNSITGQADLARVVQQATGSGAAKGLGGAIADTQKQLEAKYGRAYTNALKVGAKQEADQLEKHFKDRQKKLTAEFTQLARQQEKLASLADKHDDHAGKKKARNDIKRIENTIRLEQAAQEKLIDQREASQERMVDLMDRGMQQAADNLETRTEKIAKGFGGTIEGIMASGGSVDPSQMLKSAGGGLKEAAPGLMAKGGKMAGSSNKMVAMLGKGAMALGAAAGAIAGVVAGLAAVVAVFGMAYGRAKDMNKALLESGAAMDIVGGSSTSLGDGLSALRQAAQGVATNLRLTTDEVTKMLGAFNEVGLTFREMRSYVNFAHDDLTAYTAVAQQAIKASTAFGVQGQEIASFTNMLFRDMGQNFLGVQEALGGIFGSAQLANMSMRQFFTSINEATSSMALMNFRMEDTAELLIAMVDILGEDMGKEMSKFKGKFRDMGHTDRMGSVIKSGGAGRKVVGAMAERQTSNFLSDLKTAVGGKGAMGALKSMGLIKKGKLDVSGLKGAELGQIQEIVASAAGEGGEAIAIRLAKLARVQRGSREDATLGQRATALGQADDLGELAYGFVEAAAILGDKTVGEMENLDRATYEAVTGRSGGELEAMMDVSNRMAARIARDTGKDINSITAEDIGIAVASGDMHLSDSDKQALKDAREASLPEMEKIARQQLSETTSISQTLKNKVGGLLEKTYGLLSFWADDDVDTSQIDFYMDSSQRKRQEATEARTAFEEKGADDYTEEAKTVDKGQKSVAYWGKDEKAQRSMLGDEKYDEMVQASIDSMRAIELKNVIWSEMGAEQHEAAYGAALGGTDTDAAIKQAQFRQTKAAGVEVKGTAASDYIDKDQDSGNKYLKHAGRDTGMLPGSMAVKAGALILGGVTELLNTVIPGVDSIGHGPDVTAESEKELAAAVGDAAEAQAEAEIGAGKKDTAKLVDTSKMATKDIVEAINAGNRDMALSEIAGATGKSVGDVQKMTKTQLRTAMANVKDNPAALAALAFRSAQLDQGVDDFIYRGGSRGGHITPINKADQFLGMKPDGAISQAMGGGVVNNFYINGNNPTQIVSVVRRAVKAALGK